MTYTALLHTRHQSRSFSSTFREMSCCRSLYVLKYVRGTSLHFVFDLTKNLPVGPNKEDRAKSEVILTTSTEETIHHNAWKTACTHTKVKLSEKLFI